MTVIDRELSFDFPDFRVGTAEYEAGPTGCTVFDFDRGPCLCAVDERGGAVGSRELSSVSPGAEYGSIDALLFSGGSTYGLAAADGVMAGLFERRKRSSAFMDSPSVPGAVVYDFAGRSDATIYPNADLGRQAFDRARQNRLRVGRAGAGRNVSVGKYFGRDHAEPSGQGAAFLESPLAGIQEPLKLFAFTVLNAVGNILDEHGSILRGSVFPGGGRRPVAERLRERLAAPTSPAQGNTTISLVITNVALDRTELQRLAAMTHTAMARAIEPFQTAFDGDVLFAVSTASLAKPKGLHVNDLGCLAGTLMQNAVRSPFRQT